MYIRTGDSIVFGVFDKGLTKINIRNDNNSSTILYFNEKLILCGMV